jgi:ATP-dependent DNA helicase RecG
MITKIGHLKANMTATIIGRVLGKGILKGRRSRLEVMIGDDTGYIALIWFEGYKYLEKQFNKGDLYAVTGPITYFQQLQIVHPEIERMEDLDSELIHTGRIVPVYPSTSELKQAGLTGRVMRRIINLALEKVGGKLTDYLPSNMIMDHKLYSLPQALNQIHYPESMDNIESARRRLAFDELLELQYLVLSVRKYHTGVIKKHKYHPSGDMVKRFITGLPFQLTLDQQKAAYQIMDDMQRERPMHRLLQGDVGCGKTVVALIAAVYAAENKLQTAFMAPTELLAEQHYTNWELKLRQKGLTSALLFGSTATAERRIIENRITSGDIDIVFGTHALLSDPVQFKRLGLVIIDEQHRFGVLQRGKLIGKGEHPDTLVMSATPIPRTLALTLYGDLDITTIKSMPPGRKPTKTFWRTAASRPEMYIFLKSKLEQGDQLFFIYPLVEKSEKLDLKAAEDEYKRLKAEIFPEYKVGLVHGRVKKESREKTIRDFKNGRLKILVATTVIEVGIDIPAASIMVIEHAERFGLSQLHQLRGRVGRGNKPGLAIAIAEPPLSEHAEQRLNMFQASSNGFEIAESDLKLRGPGEFFGTKQHGLPELKVADLSIDSDLLQITRKIIAGLFAKDKNLDSVGKNMLKYLSAKVHSRRKMTRFG